MKKGYLFILGCLLSLNLFSQEIKEDTLAEVIVVGNRGANRTLMNTPVPVDVIDIKDLQESAPLTNLNDLLNYLVPSFNNNRQSASDGTEHIDPASLRGLGPDQVLVLINGKRRHTTSLVNYQNTVGNGSVGTDLSTIPVIAVERIEVLRDGAAAQFGSDAIAGVINVVLKKNTGISSSFTYGQTSKGDGNTYNLDLNYGTKIGEKGYLSLSGLYSYRAKTNRTQNHNLIIFDQSSLDNYFAYDFTADPAASRAYDDAIIAQRGLTRDDFNFQVGDAQIANYQFFANFQAPLTEKINVYGFGGMSHREGEGFGFRRLPSELSSEALEVYPNGFQPILGSKIDDNSLAAGLNYQSNGWHLDLSNVVGFNQFKYNVLNSFNYSLGNDSPTQFNAGLHNFLQNTVNFDLNKTFDVLAGLNMALGGEYRIEEFQIKAGEGASYIGEGAESFKGFSPYNEVTEDRNNIAGYLQLDLDITDNLFLGAALRYEDYSDFGGTFNYKVNARWEFIKGVAVRGAVSSGFRAPSLQQRYFNNIATDIVDGELLNSGIFRNDSDIAKAIGIQPLKEETSFNASAGFSINPIKRLNISIDGYYVKIDDRIILTGNLGNDAFGDPVQEIRDFFLPYGASTGRFFTNAINTDTYGLDVVANYTFPDVLNGKIDISLTYNYNKNEIERNADGSVKYNDFPQFLTKFSGQEEVFFGPMEQSLIETNTPNHKGALRLSYFGKLFSVVLSNTYFGEVTRNGFPFGIIQEHKGKIVTDLSLGYNITKNLNFTIGANNLFDVYPDEQVYENSYFGVFKYAPVQMGTTGTYFFGRLNLNF